MKQLAIAVSLLAVSLAGCAAAQDGPVQSAGPVAADAPDLIVAISVDQLSADLFEQYRPYFTDGLAKLQQGAVFQNGYQAHAASETCPGHSTILTGRHPANNGIIANGWADFTVARENKEIYCAEDATQVPQDAAGEYVPSAINLLVPTLGELLKAASPGSQNVAVSGKDRAALMMGGKTADAAYWWNGRQFGPAARSEGDAAALGDVNGEIANALQSAEDLAAYPVPEWCAARATPVIAPARPIGDGRFAIEAGDARAFRASPRLDEMTTKLAGNLIEVRGLGGDDVPDLLAVSYSATDYVGHAFGTNGLEQCIQIAQLDATLGELFGYIEHIAGITDYAVVLTADHGGLDTPERARLQAQPEARRADPALTPATMGARLGEELDLAGPVLLGESAAGDIYVDPALSANDKARVLDAARSAYFGHPDVQMVLTSAQIMAIALPEGNPRDWSLIERLRASHYPGRSGDLIVLLKPGVTPITDPSDYYVSTHGSPWDYDRRVPILFWRAGMTQFEQPLPVMTVDIAPTLAAMLGLELPAGTFDGRCLDLDPGEGTTCE